MTKQAVNNGTTTVLPSLRNVMRLVFRINVPALTFIPHDLRTPRPATPLPPAHGGKGELVLPASGQNVNEIYGVNFRVFLNKLVEIDPPFPYVRVVLHDTPKTNEGKTLRLAFKSVVFNPATERQDDGNMEDANYAVGDLLDLPSFDLLNRMSGRLKVYNNPDPFPKTIKGVLRDRMIMIDFDVNRISDDLPQKQLWLTDNAELKRG